MKYFYFTLFSTLALFSIVFGQTEEMPDSTRTLPVDSLYSATDPFDQFYLNFSAYKSLISQHNSIYSANIGFQGSSAAMEMNIIDLSIIEHNGSRYYSSNSLPLLAGIALGFPIMLLETMGSDEKEETGWATVAIVGLVVGPPAAVTYLTNFKLGYPVNKNITVLAGQKTDYYLFYPVSKIHTQSQIGARLALARITCNVFFNYPWTRGYLDHKETSLSIGVGYDLFRKKLDDPSKKYENRRRNTGI